VPEPLKVQNINCGPTHSPGAFIPQRTHPVPHALTRTHPVPSFHSPGAFISQDVWEVWKPFVHAILAHLALHASFCMLRQCICQIAMDSAHVYCHNLKCQKLETAWQTNFLAVIGMNRASPQCRRNLLLHFPTVKKLEIHWHANQVPVSKSGLCLIGCKMYTSMIRGVCITYTQMSWDPV